MTLVGAFDFSKMETDGTFKKVGIRRIKITDKGLEAAVFYPMDESENSQERALWFADAKRTISSMKRVFGPMFGVPYFPDFILRPYTRVKTHAIV